MIDEVIAPGIGTLNEKPLHESLKRWYAEPGDLLETRVEGFVVDIVHGSLLVEIQTAHFGAIRRKLERLLPSNQIRLVYPIAQEKWITKSSLDGPGQPIRRKSPRRGSFASVFNELVSIPTIPLHPNFSLELLLIQEEEIRRYDGVRGWRKRGWVTHERRLVSVLDRRVLRSSADLAALLPATLPDEFTTADMAAGLKQPQRLAQRMAYCLRRIGCINAVGKRSNSVVYTRL